MPGRIDSAAANASLSHFSGLFGAVVSTDGDVSGAAPGVVAFGNSTGYNDLFQSVTLGGRFHFQVQFSGAFQTTSSVAGTSFDVGVMDGGFAYLGNQDGSVVHFELTPLNGALPASVNGTVTGGIASISAVPEVPQWMMLAAGLALAGCLRRRAAYRV